MPTKRVQQGEVGPSLAVVQSATTPPASLAQQPQVPPPQSLDRVPLKPDDYYPYEDDIPMASSPEQLEVMVDIRQSLANHFLGRPYAYIGIDMLVYDKQGDRDSHVTPDVFVAFGVGGAVGRSYRVWEVGKPPDIVWEFGSASTDKGDWKEKKERYRRWGVPEYWLYDPHGGLHRPRLQGFQLVEGRYARLPAESRGRRLRSVKSPLLGLELHFDGRRLRLWNPVTEEYLRNGRESERDRLKERAKRLEARAKRLKAAARADAATRRADAAAKARREAEDRVAELERQIARLIGSGSGTRDQA